MIVRSDLATREEIETFYQKTCKRQLVRSAILNMPMKITEQVTGMYVGESPIKWILSWKRKGTELSSSGHLMTYTTLTLRMDTNQVIVFSSDDGLLSEELPFIEEAITKISKLPVSWKDFVKPSIQK